VEATMRKRVITAVSQNASVPSQEWLEVESAAVVEVTSEDTAYPIESAVLLGQKQGWRAAKPGTQTIRLIFDEPHNLRRIRLVFDETETRRTQEFLLRWSANTGQSFREIVRQQWNFSSPGAVREIEDYAVELVDVGYVLAGAEPFDDVVEPALVDVAEMEPGAAGGGERAARRTSGVALSGRSEQRQVRSSAAPVVAGGYGPGLHR